MHMIDESNEQANIAYVNEVPWHGLGQNLEEGQPIEVWAKAAGLSHSVIAGVVQYHCINDDEGATRQFPKRSVLYRSDTGKPLSVVSNQYKIVQPLEVLDFIHKLTEHNGFTMETAGSLDGGKRIWALARVSDGATVVGQDVVRPYVLFATSYDGTMATTAKLTTVRVVCHNTLSMSVGYSGPAGGIKGEADTEHGTVRVYHSKTFNPEAVRLDLGIAHSAFDKFLIESRRLAKRQVGKTFATEFLKTLLPAGVKTEVVKGEKIVTPIPVEETKAFDQIMSLFRGEALGSGLSEANGTAWGLLNAITQHVDHQRGRSADTRMGSAWFGGGNALKDKAHKLLLEVVS